MNAKTFGIFVILASLSACAGIKPKNDCSAIFEKDSAKVGLNLELQKNTQCKVLPIKFKENTSCEFSGSDTLSNLISTMDHRNDAEIIVSIPLKVFVNTKSMSYADMIKYYFMMKRFTNSFDSDLFGDLKDSTYKGMNCKISDGKFTAWVGEGTVFVIMDEKTMDKIIDFKPKK